MGTNVNEAIKFVSITYLVNYYSLFNFTLIEVFPFSNYMIPSSFILEAEPHVDRTEEPLFKFKVDPKEEIGETPSSGNNNRGEDCKVLS